MVHIEWIINTTSGPAVGSADTDDVEGAWTAVRAALTADLPSWGPDHAAALAGLERASRAALATGDRWHHVAASFVVSMALTPGGAGQ